MMLTYDKGLIVGRLVYVDTNLIDLIKIKKMSSSYKFIKYVVGGGGGKKKKIKNLISL